MRGFTLIEILVSFLILSMLLYGFSALDVVAVRESQAAYRFSVATAAIAEMSERLRALGEHQGLADQIAVWQQSLLRELPTATATVSGVFPRYQIQVCLQPKNCLQQVLQL